MSCYLNIPGLPGIHLFWPTCSLPFIPLLSLCQFRSMSMAHSTASKQSTLNILHRACVKMFYMLWGKGQSQRPNKTQKPFPFMLNCVFKKHIWSERETYVPKLGHLHNDQNANSSSSKQLQEPQAPRAGDCDGFFTCIISSNSLQVRFQFYFILLKRGWQK